MKRNWKKVAVASITVRSKFLKLAYRIHETQGTLDLKDPNMDGVLDIYDLGVVITHLITKISNKAQPTTISVSRKRKDIGT